MGRKLFILCYYRQRDWALVEVTISFIFLMAVLVSCVYLFKAVVITYSCPSSLFALVPFSRDAFGLQGAAIPTIDPDRFHM